MKYWNDYEETRKYINKKISTDENIDVFAFLKKYILKNNIQKFKRTLVINCGTGWIERRMHSLNLSCNYDGVDCSYELLEQAKSLSKEIPINYKLIDIEDDFINKSYDLVVNHSACHNFAYLNKVLYNISKFMDKSGLFFSFNYVGPHRHQYPEVLWREINKLNDKLHESCKNDLLYPHLPTMLKNNPKESIHSELFLTTHNRYFETLHHVRAGGALAYPILTRNQNLSHLEDCKLRDEQIRFVLEEDNRHLNLNPDSSFFDLIISKPKEINDQDAKKYLYEEEQRERDAKENLGLYYPLTEFQKNYIVSSFKSLTNKKYLNWTDYMSTSIERYNDNDFITSDLFFNEALKIK